METLPDDFIKVSAERAKERIEELKEGIRESEEHKKQLLEDLEIVKHPITKELIEFELGELEWDIECDKIFMKELEEAVVQHEKKLGVK